MSDKIIPQKYLDRIGEVHGLNVIVGFKYVLYPYKLKGTTNNITAIIRCECGKIRTSSASKIPGSCNACRAKSDNRFKTHGLSRTPEFRAWEGAKARSCNPNNKDFKNYGARGIKMCKRWQDKKYGFVNFSKDMGPKPEPKSLFSLDRVNNNGDYKPSNCRWATAKQQYENRRPIKFKHKKNCTACSVEYMTLEPNKSKYCSRKCNGKSFQLRRKKAKLLLA